MDLAVNVLYRVIDHLMLKFIKAAVGLQGVGIECAASLHVLTDFGLKRFLLSVGDHGGADCTVLPVLAPLKNPHNGGLVFSAGAGDLDRPYRCVHVARLLADEGFVGFNMPGEFIRRRYAERNPNPVIQEPCGLLSDVQGAGDFATAHTVLAIHHEPHSHEPLVQAERRFFVDSAGLERELAL